MNIFKVLNKYQWLVELIILIIAILGLIAGITIL